MKMARLFLWSSAVLLLATSAVNLITSISHSRMLLQRDHVTGLLFYDSLRLVAVMEMAVAFACLLSKRIWLSTLLLA